MQNDHGRFLVRYFSLGFGIRTSPIASWIPGAPGSFGWGGHWGTYFWVDPARDLAAVLMLQLAPFASRPAVEVLDEFEVAVYADFWEEKSE